MNPRKKFDVLVIGAGINGLATAYHLSQQAKLKIGLIEQFSVGNAYGGSHGASRIIRSTYSNSIYIRLMHRARNQDWIDLEKKLGSVLIHPNSGCFFGSGKIFEKYVQSIMNRGLDIDALDVLAARRIFPQFRFSNVLTILHDRTGGVIAARQTIDKLAEAIVKNEVELYENTKVLKIESSQDPIKVITNLGELLADRLVITTGAWMKQLIPTLNSIVTPIQQTVAYFKLQGPQNSYQIGRFPNWAFIGEGENPVFYGLPEFGYEGIKVSQHITMGKQDDPDEKRTFADPKQLKFLKEFVEEQFVQSIDEVVSSETCIYANTPNEDFIIDLLPTDKRIAVGSVCSGHGFKFAPLTGLLLSELVLNGKTTVPEFEESKKMFSIIH